MRIAKRNNTLIRNIWICSIVLACPIVASAFQGRNLQADGGRTYAFDLASLDMGASGQVVIQTHPEWAPNGVERFHALMDASFYEDCKIFRVVPNFMVQFGMPGIPETADDFPEIKDDPVIETNSRGKVTFAMRGPNTRTTQIFVNTNDSGNGFLDSKGFAPFAEVISGMEVIDRIYSGYGERPDQGSIGSRGNEYLEKEFPLLTYVESTSRLEEEEFTDSEPGESTNDIEQQVNEMEPSSVEASSSSCLHDLTWLLLGLLSFITVFWW